MMWTRWSMPVPGEELRYEIDFGDPSADAEPDEEFLQELDDTLSRMLEWEEDL